MILYPHPAPSYFHLSEKDKGRTRMTYIKRGDLFEIKRKAEEYARFQHTLARLTKINFKIRSLLERMRDLNCQDVDKYRRKVMMKKKGNLKVRKNESIEQSTY